MAHAQPGLSTPLGEDHRRLLADLEATSAPTPYAKGALAALRLAALNDDERRRVDALTARCSA